MFIKRYQDIIAICMVLLTYMNQVKLVLCVNPVLNIKENFPYLLDKTTGRITEPRDYMDFENIYAPNSTYKRHQTAQGKNYHMIKAFDFANLYKSDYWHYSNEQDLKLSAYPVANESRCTQQLRWIESYLNDSKVLFKPGEQHVNLMTLMDSFGRPEASTYFGHGYWMGSYYECTRVAIDMAAFEREEAGSIKETEGVLSTDPSASSSKLKTRYCVGKVRDIDWPTEEEDNYKPRISYKVGLCLPESCETLSFERHKNQIERLMRLNMPEYLKSRFYLDGMYCLPDSRSPIRQLGLSSKVFLGSCIIWLLLISVATWIHSYYRWQQRDLKRMTEQVRIDLAQQALVASSQAAQVTVSTNDKKLANYIVHEPIVHLQPVCVEQDGVKSQLNHKITYENHQQQTTDNTSHMLHVIQGSHPSPLLFQNQVNSQHQQRQDQQLICEPKQLFFNSLDETDETEEDHKRALSSSKHSSSSSLSARLTESHPMLLRILQCLSIKENMIEFQQKPAMLRIPNANKRLRINLNALDSIKCLCCILVIFGHIVFIHMQHLSNIVHTIDQSHQVSPRLLIAFFNFVDTFFIISGMLTAYFVFKRFNKNNFANPLVWVSISLLRLIRLSPVYLLVFWFVKTVGVHLSEGPLWDYGTDRGSIKSLCVNDHWWKSLLYLGNWGTMQPVCILPAWSIIVDAQYSLILPPILFLIFKHKRLGYLSLFIAIIVSTVNMSYQLMTQTAVKTSDMAKIRLHVYPLISRFAAEFYNAAWNRIGPVAIGVLGGHALYLYEVGVIKRWPWFMRGLAFKFILFMHLFIFILPTIGRYTDQPDQSTSSEYESDITVFVLSNATIKPIWSVINTVLLLRIITDLRVSSQIARLMSHSIWHPLGKLCFASYLIHYEVILYLLKSRPDSLLNPTWWNALREFSLAFLISTVLAYFIHILYEAPINKLVMLNVSKKPRQLLKNDESSEPTIGDDKERSNKQQQQQQQHQVGINLTSAAKPYQAKQTLNKQRSANFPSLNLTRV